MKVGSSVEAKHAEIIGIAAAAIRDEADLSDADLQQLASKITDSFATITPPEGEYVMKLITMSDVGHTTSTKPGNIRLSWKKLIVHASEALLTVAGAVAQPWLSPLAALVVWDRVWSGLKLQLSERHAVVIWAMWRNHDGNRRIPRADVLDRVNEELSTYRHREMDRDCPRFS